MFLADLTWEEVRDYIRNKDGLIIPIGICEQHSKHLPLNTDTLVAEYICDYLSDKTGILIAPTINYGIGLPCDKHYPGSTSISYEDLRNVLSVLISWWKLQGFQKFFAVSAHGDPFHLKALRNTGHNRVYVLELYDINLEGILEKQTTAKHACEAETSVMLYLFPDKVRKEKIEDFEMPFEEFKIYLNHLRDDAIPNSPGCLGYPSYATAKKGKRIIQKMKENALTWIRTVNQ